MAGELVARADVDASFARVHSRLLAIPSGAASLLVGADLPHAVTVEGVVHDALRELSETAVEDLTGA